MIFDEFIKKYTGKGIDFDGAFGNQCVDLYRQYCKEVLNFSQSPPVRGAADIWDSYLKGCFTRIANTPNGIPDKGDIIIWSKNTGGGYGHVAVFVEGTIGSFRSFDQNWPSGSLCKVVNHYYTNVLGWLHPISNQGADYYKEIDLNNKESIKICVDIWSDVVNGKYVKKENYVELEKKLKENDEVWKERVDNERRQYNDFIGILAQKVDSTQDEPAIIEQITRLIQVEDSVNSQLKPKIGRLEERIKDIARILEVEEDRIEKRINELNTIDVIPLHQEIESLKSKLKAVKEDAISNIGWIEFIIKKLTRKKEVKKNDE